MTTDQQTQFQQGLDLFNADEFYDCHEVLEELWEDLLGNEKRSVQGILQVAVGFYHLRTGNLNGARSQFRKALGKFEKFPPPSHFPMDIPALEKQMKQTLDRLSPVTDLTTDLIGLPAPTLNLNI